MSKCMWIAVCALCAGLLVGCGGSVDEDKPVDQIKAEAAQWDADKIEDVIEEYKEAIEEKTEKLQAELAKLKDIPLTEITGEKAKSIKVESEKLATSLDKLKDQLEAYVDALKEKKQD